MLAGRGFGKTRTGAEWVDALARRDGALRIALVAAGIDEGRRVMVEGHSGILALTGDDRIEWRRSEGRLRWSSGAEAYLYSGASPELLRGPEHHAAWCDELAKWARPEATWDNLLLGLRAGGERRVLVTTTPRPLPLLRRIADDPATVLSQGRTADNPFLPGGFVDDMAARYGGSRLGRQELDGELFDDVEGALWTRSTIERARAPLLDGGGFVREFFDRIVIGVDPPASASGDACGILVCGLGSDGTGYVLADETVRGLAPEGWAEAVADAAERWEADLVVAETNQGGDMVESVLRAAEHDLPLKTVHASQGKSARAEPVAALFSRGRAKLAGLCAELEDELLGMTRGRGYAGPGRSPDRADAMVWALTELMLGEQRRARARWL